MYYCGNCVVFHFFLLIIAKYLLHVDNARVVKFHALLTALIDRGVLLNCKICRTYKIEQYSSR